MNTSTLKTELEWFDTLPSHLQYAARQAWSKHHETGICYSIPYYSLGEALENSFMWEDYGFWVQVIEEYDPEYYRLKALKEKSVSDEPETYTYSMDFYEFGDWILQYNAPEPLITFQNGYLKFHDGSMLRCYKHTIDRVTSYKSDYKNENPFTLMITTTNRDLTSYIIQYPTQEMLDQALSELNKIVIEIN